METIVVDKLLAIGFGSVITILLAVIGYFLRQSNEEVKQMLAKINDHETRISLTESHVDRHERNFGDINRELADDIVAKLRAITSK
jgi:hypothetical protein